MKTVLVVQEKVFNEEFYTYVPEQYGPFSKTVYDDVDELVSEGFVKIDTNTVIVDYPIIGPREENREIYKLTDKGETVLRNARKSEFDASETELPKYVKGCEDFDLFELIDYTAIEFPHLWNGEEKIHPDMGMSRKHNLKIE